MILIIVNFTAAGVQETFQKLLSLAVVLQLVPFLYMFRRIVEACRSANHSQKRATAGHAAVCGRQAD